MYTGAMKCVRCGKPVEKGRRKYCSDACADSALRARIKLGKLVPGMTPRRWFQTYDYRDK